MTDTPRWRGDGRLTSALLILSTRAAIMAAQVPGVVRLPRGPLTMEAVGPTGATGGRRFLRAWWTGLACASMLAAAPLAQEPFRSSTDVIAVDVQVVDSAGNPVDTLSRDAFDVSIRGQKRLVLSTDFVRHAWVSPPGSGSGVLASEVGPTSRGGRVLLLAIDIGSFEPGAERGPLEAAESFVAQLEPSDRVGLYVFPNGAWIPPSTDRVALGVTLARLVGRRQSIRSYYNLKPWEIVDISTQSTNPNSFLTTTRRLAVDPTSTQHLDLVMRIQARECPGDQNCPIRIYNEGMELARQLEQQALNSLDGLQRLLRGLATVDGRKAVVVLSGGVPVSDRPEGRPDVGDLARLMGQEAARANAVVYTIHVDTYSALGGTLSRGGSISTDMGRDRAMFGTWLHQFSDAAGGGRLYVPTGSGAFAFERVLRESSGYYLLGVEPEAEDRDGRPRELNVKVRVQGLTVRSRKWVVIPGNGGSQATGVVGN